VPSNGDSVQFMGNLSRELLELRVLPSGSWGLWRILINKETIVHSTTSEMVL
jgi:hypothetical protein